MIRNLSNARSQRGITLVVVLLLLVIVTLLGLAAMRGTIMQERMSGNVTARSMAFQSAESALRAAEEWLINSNPAPSAFPATGCSAGRCAMPVDGATAAWEAANFWTTGSGYRTAADEADATKKLAVVRYVVESLGTGTTAAGAGGPSECLGAEGDESGCQAAPADATVRNFRITAYAQTDNGAQVLLQSTFQMP